MRTLFPAFLLLILAAASASAADYATARTAAPVFNTPAVTDIFRSGSIRTDGCGQVRELEFTALPGTLFRLLEKVERDGRVLWRVESADYPYPTKSGYYVEAAFLAETDAPQEREKKLPPREEVLRRLREAAGTPYVWGGNVTGGIPEMLTLHPPARPDSRDAQKRTLAGLDCSGLLYQATGGSTPRNTSTLIRFGHGVPVAGLSAAAIAARLQPLDLIVWNGHVMIVLDAQNLIESRLACGTGAKSGVVIRPLKAALEELMRKRRAVDDYDGASGERFVIRRWWR